MARAPALEITQVAPLRRRRSAGVLLRKRVELATRLHLGRDLVGLLLGLLNRCRVRIGRERYQDLAQPHLLRLCKLLLVRVVVGLLLRLRHLQPSANLVPHNLLRNHIVLDICSEVLKAHTLLPGSLLERRATCCRAVLVFDRVQVILLADLVQPPDHLRVRVQTELLALGKQQLLVDHVAQHVLLPLLALRR